MNFTTASFNTSFIVDRNINFFSSLCLFLCTRIGMLINHIKNEMKKKLKRYKQRMINFYSCYPKQVFRIKRGKNETFHYRDFCFVIFFVVHSERAFYSNWITTKEGKWNFMIIASSYFFLLFVFGSLLNTQLNLHLKNGSDRKFNHPHIFNDSSFETLSMCIYFSLLLLLLFFYATDDDDLETRMH